MRRFPAAFLVALILLLAGAQGAGAFTNGDAPAGAMAPIASGVHCTPLEGQLETRAAAAFNTMALGAGEQLPTNGCDSAYRPLSRQVYYRSYWCGLGSCGNAAVPGTSNHGLGRAVDIPEWVQGYFKLHGVRYHWVKNEAFSEPWHYTYAGGYNRPNPGLNLHSPTLRLHSGGPGQGIYVRKVQKLLRGHGDKSVTVDGEFGTSTAIAIRRFEKAQHLPVNGVVSKRVWKRLRRPATKPIKTVPKHTPKPTTPPPPAPAKHHPGKIHHPKGPAWGIDISNNNGTVDWKAVRGAGASFAIVKASEGQDYIDPNFSRAELRSITSAHLIPGVYHFLRPRADRTGAREAAWFTEVIGHAGYGKGFLPPVLDVETTELSPSSTCTYVGSFLRLVRRNLGVKAIVYTYPGFAAENFSGCSWLGKYRLWIANYGVSAPTIPTPWANHLMWQYTSTGHVNGVGGYVDLNKLIGGQAALADLRINGLPKRARLAPRAKIALPLAAESKARLRAAAPAAATPRAAVPAPEGEAEPDPRLGALADLIHALVVLVGSGP